ncbi:MAG: phage holin family protein [Persicimonas sp.]
MLKLIVRLLVNAVAIWAAAELVGGMTLDMGSPVGVVLVALVFGIVNAVLKPIAKVLGFPFIILTLGLFTLVINAGLLALTAWLVDALAISGFWPALWGALVVSIVSWFLGMFVSDSDD